MASQNTIIEDALINGAIEGCIQIPCVAAGASDYKLGTLVYLDGTLLSNVVSANAAEGWVDRCILKPGHPYAIQLSDVEVNEDNEMQTERLYGNVILLVCSPKMLRLLQEVSKHHG